MTVTPERVPDSMAGARKVRESQKPKRAIRTTIQTRTPRNLTAHQAKKPRTTTS
jgi:hypothetical protein